MVSIGRNIRVFLVDGSPGGLITAEIMNWTGHVLFAPRSRLVDLLGRAEASKTGVYLLVGEQADGVPRVYVGEGDNVGIRIAAHSRDETKDFWEQVCLVTSKDTNLTKAHVRYLESRLLSLIRAEGRAELANGTAPDGIQLPEADSSDMEYFVEQLQVLLPVLGLGFVRQSPPRAQVNPNGGDDTLVMETEGALAARASYPRSRPSVVGAQSPIFVLSDRSALVTAKAVELDGQMVILSGSEAKQTEMASLASNIRGYRRRLIETGKLGVSGKQGVLVFNEDVSFTSPSAAAQAVMGTSRNGRTDWVTEKDGITYASWQEQQLAKAVQSMASPED